MTQPRAPRCAVHLPPFDLIEYPDKTRPGYFRGECAKCGTFIGYRSTEEIRKERREWRK